MRSEQEVGLALERYADTVRRLCMIHLKNYADTEDIFQTVFLKYSLSSSDFASEEHEKAWIIRVTLNACKDLLKSVFRSRTAPLDALPEQGAALPEESRELLEAVLSLPLKYRQAVYLYYYESYSVREIAETMGANASTVQTWLMRARGLLRESLQEA